MVFVSKWCLSQATSGIVVDTHNLDALEKQLFAATFLIIASTSLDQASDV